MESFDTSTEILSEDEILEQYCFSQRLICRLIVSVILAEWEVLHTSHPTYWNFALFVLFSLLNFIFWSNTKRKYRSKLESLDLSSLRLAWNLFESSPIIGVVRYLVSPKVSVCKELWIPREKHGMLSQDISEFKRDWIRAYILSAVPLSSLSTGYCILHIHGGGMIAQSPISHFEYLKRLSIQTKLPIVSIDYRLAPEYPFPHAVDDCFTAYKWILENGSELGFSAAHIILFGDSAGGNLAAVTLLKVIKEHLKMPMGLLLIYPLTCKDRKTRFPSFERFQNDFILPRKFFQLISNAYEGNHDVQDPLISPLLASDDIFRQFPITHILVGSQDPLLDDSRYFYGKLQKLSRNPSYLHVYQGLAHGFFSVSFLLPNVSSIISSISNWIFAMNE